MSSLSVDAIIFGFGLLNGPKMKLSFGGDGAKFRITDRARRAINELISEGYAKNTEPSDSIPNREHYVGVERDLHLGFIAREIGLNPFDIANSWTTFEPISEETR